MFCGSSPGWSPAYRSNAEDLARALAETGVEVVYGGGHVGLMGIVADTAMAAGGRVTGVITQSLVEREVAHTGLTTLHITADMHSRKAMMADLSDAFVALPGGFGTFDELFEVLTWAQLGLHVKPIVLLDIDGFFGPFFDLADRAVGSGFLKAGHRALAQRATSIAEVMAALATPPMVPEAKWISR